MSIVHVKQIVQVQITKSILECIVLDDAKFDPLVPKNAFEQVLIIVDILRELLYNEPKGLEVAKEDQIAHMPYD